MAKLWQPTHPQRYEITNRGKVWTKEKRGEDWKLHANSTTVVLTIAAVHEDTVYILRWKSHGRTHRFQEIIDLDEVYQNVKITGLQVGTETGNGPQTDIELELGRCYMDEDAAVLVETSYGVLPTGGRKTTEKLRGSIPSPWHPKV